MITKVPFFAVVLCLAFAGLIGLLWVGLYHDARLIPSPLIGKKLPSFYAPSLFDEKSMIRNADFAGRSVVINVWASWCLACLEEHPIITELARQNQVVVLGLNYKDTRKDALNWLTTHKNPYQEVIFDPLGKVGLDWGVYGVPETYFINPQGIVFHKQVGAIDWDTVTTIIVPFLKIASLPPSD